MKEGRLGYNDQNGRYGLLTSDLWEHDGFHCGESLEIMIDGTWFPTRMEMAWENGEGTWYLAGTPFRGCDIEYIHARIK